MKDSSTSTRRNFLLATGAAFCALPLGAAAAGGDWPTKSLRVIVPFAAGISPDVVMRLVGDPLSRALGQPLVIDNRAGASGMIGAQTAARSPADGYTVFLSVESIVGVLPHVYATLPYDHFKDFAPVTELVLVPYFLVASPDFPSTTLAEVLQQARAAPGAIHFASLGVGSGAHVRMEMLNNMGGTRMNHVPYKGSPMIDLMAGQIGLVFEPATTAIPLIKAGKVRALAVTSLQPHPLLPDVPPVAATLPGYQADGWQGLFVPTGTPPEIVSRLNQETVSVLKLPEVQARIVELGLQPVGNSPEAFAAITRNEYDKWGRIARATHIRVD